MSAGQGDAVHDTVARGGSGVAVSQAELLDVVSEPRRALLVGERAQDGQRAVAGVEDAAALAAQGYQVTGQLPPLYPEWLGDRGFNEAHGVRYPYIAGAMANGIATPQLVIAMGRAQMLGFYGAAGLGFDKVERGIEVIRSELGGQRAAWGANLIHSPNEPSLEDRAAMLFVERGVPNISASAYMKLTPSIVKAAYRGVSVGPDGVVHRPRAIFAKISRVETALHFLNPAPEAMLRGLVSRGELTEEEARLAATLPVAEDITAESDSGGHTDNRPLAALLPEIMATRDAVMRERGYSRHIRVGAAGGLGTPNAVAAAFAMGAAYVLTGSVNQSAVEAGLSESGKEMLAKAGIADVIMAPAADMFELGVEVQVLKRGTMFGTRAKKLHELYNSYDSVEAIPVAVREQVEQRVLGASMASIWEETRGFWQNRDASELAKAEREPKHKMALIFRWYLGKASKWAIDGEPGRTFDYQIWCGPAMGAFNTWVKGSFLEDPSERGVAQIALNLLEGAAVVTRAHQLRTFGVPIPASAFDFRPRPLA